MPHNEEFNFGAHGFNINWIEVGLIIIEYTVRTGMAFSREVLIYSGYELQGFTRRDAIRRKLLRAGISE